MTASPPSLRLAEWQSTRDSLHVFARILGTIRRQYMPPAKHWWHITLSVSARGLTTTPFPIAGQFLDLTLDLAAHRLVIDSSAGWHVAVPLEGESERALCDQILAVLTARGIDLEPDLLAGFDGEAVLAYDEDAVDRFRRTLAWVDGAFKRFKGGLREESGPVHVFPHHMDVSLNWFSGRRVPGVDPADEEQADEQLNFGFVTGDAAVDDAYFYVTAYPEPAGWSDLPLLEGAYWQREGWTGAVLPYAVVAAAEQPLEFLLDHFRRLQAHAAQLMA